MAVNEGNEIVPPYERGQRLYCDVCQSEVEIISPCPMQPPTLDLRCCGKPMTANIGTKPNVNVEA